MCALAPPLCPLSPALLGNLHSGSSPSLPLGYRTLSAVPGTIVLAHGPRRQSAKENARACVTISCQVQLSLISKFPSAFPDSCHCDCHFLLHLPDSDPHSELTFFEDGISPSTEHQKRRLVSSHVRAHDGGCRAQMPGPECLGPNANAAIDVLYRTGQVVQTRNSVASSVNR